MFAKATSDWAQYRFYFLHSTLTSQGELWRHREKTSTAIYTWILYMVSDSYMDNSRQEASLVGKFRSTDKQSPDQMHHTILSANIK